MPLIHLKKHRIPLDKFIWFEETDLTKVHNEIIKFNVDFRIAPKIIFSFLENLIGKVEFSKLSPCVSNPATFHGECKDTAFFQSLTKSQPFKSKSGVVYTLSEIGIDINTTRLAQSGKPKPGNIEIKYKHPTEDKHIVLNLHIIPDHRFYDPKATFDDNVAFSITDLKDCLTKFYQLDKEKIDDLEKMDLVNFSNPYGYEIAQKSKDTFNLVMSFMKQEQKITKLEKISSSLTQFFEAKQLKFTKKDSDNLSIEISSADLKQLHEKIPECKLQ